MEQVAIMWKCNLNEDGAYLTLDDRFTRLRFHAMWLRDNAWDAATRSADNGQRLIVLKDIPKETVISDATILGSSLSVIFSPENKLVDYDISWLMQNAYDRTRKSQAGWIKPCLETWDNGLMDRLPMADFASINSNNIELKIGFARLYVLALERLKTVQSKTWR